jgi:AcrR family transcriptional regulator
MDPLPARILQPQAQASRARPDPSPREQKRRDYILEAARNVFIHHGTTRVTLTEFAYATGLAPVTIRRHVCDIHHLFALVLHQHLKTIITALCLVPHGPGLFARRRAAYFTETRGICDVPTPLHFLLLRDRFGLPEDELHDIEAQLNVIAIMVAGRYANDIMALLDSPTYDLPQIEAAFAAIADIAEARAAARPPPAPQATAPAPQATIPEPRATIPAPPPSPATAIFTNLDEALADLPDSALLPAKPRHPATSGQQTAPLLKPLWVRGDGSIARGDPSGAASPTRADDPKPRPPPTPRRPAFP